MNPLWGKSPLLLFRFPGLGLSILLGALLLAVAAASSPLFTSSAARSALAHELEATTAFGAGVTIGQAGPFVTPVEERRRGKVGSYRVQDRILLQDLANVSHLADRVLTLLGATVDVRGERGRTHDSPVRLLARTGALEHVEKLSGRDGGGVWIADTVATPLGLGPGDTIAISLPNEKRRTDVTVDGIYRALWKAPTTTPYWRSLYGQIYPRTAGQPPPATFLLADEGRLRDLSEAVGQDFAQYRWEFPVVAEGLTLPQAERLRDRLEDFQRRLENLESNLGRSFAEGGSQAAFGLQVDYASSLSTVVSRATHTVAGIGAPVDLLSTAGSLVAVAVIAAAGAFAMARRRTEASLLYARGMSLVAVGAKAALESLLPVAIGTAAGLGIAIGLVALLGPGGAADPTAVVEAARAVGLRLPVALLLLGLVTAFVFLRRSGSTQLGLLGRLPWEVVALGVAGFSFQKLHSDGAFVTAGAADVARPSAALLVFPIFFIAGFAGLAARFLERPLGAARRRSTRLPPASYLAVHRLAGAQRLAVLLVSASALALGIAVYAQTVVSSLEKTVEAKSLLFVGSDVQGTINFGQDPPTDFQYPVTEVTKVLRGGELGGQQVDVMAIDTTTFAGAAYWEPSWASRSIEDLTAELRSDGGRTLPVVVAGNGAPDTDELELGGVTFPVRVVSTATASPGMSLGRPLIVLDADVLERLADEAGISNPLGAAGNSTELWARGPTEAVAGAFAASSTHPFPVVTAAEVRDNPSITAVTRTFGFLQSLGFGAGLLAVVGLVLYLQARQRSRVVSYTLSRRMGLGNASHRLSLVLELGGMLLTSLALGAVLAVLAARVVLGDVDPLANIPPAPLFRVPIIFLAGAGAALLGVSILGGLLANRSAERANFAEVMRLAD